jgi:putative ABC transport system permease protein
MSWIQRIKRRASLLLNLDRVEGLMDEEMRLHLELETEDLVRQGLSREEARRQALKNFGGVERFKEEARDARGVRLWQDLLQDVQYAFRGLRRSAGFTAVALTTLALGIGATTAIFSIVNAVLLQPLPYPDADRVFRIAADFDGKTDRNLSPAEYLDLRDGLEAASHFGAYGFGAVNVIGDAEAERVRVAFLSEGVLPAFGVVPARGRNFTRAEEVEGSSLVLLADEFWRRRFAGDPNIVGRTIVVSDNTAEVIGVIPPGFALPEDIVSGQPVAMFAPIGINPADVTDRGNHFLRGVGRLRPGVSFEAGAEAVSRSGELMVAGYPAEYTPDENFLLRAVPIRETVVGQVRPALLVLLAAVGFVLLIVCANLANLQLARSDSRRRELALRAALGADRSRIIRQLLVESSVLALLGGALGVALAYVGMDLLLALRPPNVPRLDAVRLDLAVLGFALAISAAAGIAFGLFPALRVSRLQLADRLRVGSRGLAGSRSRQRSRRSLVVAEVAIALVLLTGAGLFTRSFLQLYNVDKGFSAERMLTVRVSPPFLRYQAEEQITGFYRELIQNLLQQPGIEAAAAARYLPLATRQGDMSFELEGHPVPKDRSKPAADWQVVTPGYFRAMGIPILRGRPIEANDGAGSPGVVVVNEVMAERHWPGRNPLGARIRFGGQQTEPRWATVIGIVPNVTHNGLDAEPRPQVYLAHAQFRFWSGGSPVYSMNLVARTQGAPEAFAGTVRRSVRELDPQLPLGSFRTMNQVLSASVAQPRIIMSLLLGFSLLSLALAAVGIYGVLSYAVGERVQEFGIRMALGARAADVAATVVRSGLVLVVIGLALGLGGALLLTRLVSSLLYGVTPGDPATFATVSLTLAAVALAACYLPARRATRVDPVVSLRNE